jgi:hypothetical protein
MFLITDISILDEFILGSSIEIIFDLINDLFLHLGQFMQISTNFCHSIDSKFISLVSIGL